MLENPSLWDYVKLNTKRLAPVSFYAPINDYPLLICDIIPDPKDGIDKIKVSFPAKLYKGHYAYNGTGKGDMHFWFSPDELLPANDDNQNAIYSHGRSCSEFEE